MTGVCLGVGCERKTKVLLRFARKPLFLLRHSGGIASKERQRVKRVTTYKIIQLSLVRLLERLLRFIETLQAEQVIREISIRGDIIRGEAEALASNLRCFLVLPLGAVKVAQVEMGSVVPWVAGNPFLICLCRSIQLARYALIIESSDPQPFTLAGMLSQLECLGEIFAGAFQLTHGEVIAAHCCIAQGKIRVDFDGMLMVGQSIGCTLLAMRLLSKAVRLQGFKRRGGGLFQRSIQLLH